jgi:hypothetical protein
MAREVDMARAGMVAAELAAMLAACGTTAKLSDEPGGAPTLGDGPIVVTADGEVMVSCGNGDPGWPPSVMAEGIQGVLSQEEATTIFRGVLDDPMMGEEAGLSLFPDGVDVEWRVLRQDDDSLTLGLGRWTSRGPAGEGVHTLGMEREGNTWRVDGWGDCQLSPVLKEGLSRVEVTGYRVDAGSTHLTATVRERECASGRDPERFLHEPFVVETDSSVILYWTSEPPTGGQDCQGNPSVDRVVELKEPLGTRMVLDGLSYPPQPVRIE